MTTRRRIERRERVYAVEGTRIVYRSEDKEAYRRRREEIKEINKEKKEERVRVECWGREFMIEPQLYREWMKAIGR